MIHKKFFFGPLLMVLSVCSAVCNDLDGTVVTLTSAERRTLKSFYFYGFHKDESYLDLLDDFQINNLCNIVSIHIKILENKILQKRSGLKSMGMLKGLGWVVGCLFGGWVTHMSYQDLITGSFGAVKVPDSMLDNISTLRFSRSEKKNLDLLADTIKANGKKLIPLLSYYWFYRISDLSPSDYDKYKYLVLRLAVRKEKQGMLCGYAISAACLGAALYQFYKVSRYAERLIERLERDKRVFVLLQKQKDIRLTKQLGNSLRLL